VSVQVNLGYNHTLAHEAGTEMGEGEEISLMHEIELRPGEEFHHKYVTKEHIDKVDLEIEALYQKTENILRY
jgi:hypothetical protein